ncbi:DUF547 domain-containing protein [Rhodopirellula sp. P2]|uniref:DUF547 domain-containing protein n=1 Tax=Rhodopirellula sp. P2 TaxID=2127060 RepID=UPI002367DC5C|nr:DUF547 domain-containing protein [Rhodopirellula sp. P2]WDQ19234.1 DUF547 domain-containing protein [Rhodopirellula sp. P2]
MDTTKSDPASPNLPSAPHTRRTVIIGIAAVLLVGTATFACLHAGAIEQKLVRLFGPPQVELQEAYSASVSGPTMDHSTFDSLLKKHVDDDGWVDYAALKEDEAKLDSYLRAIAAAPFDAMGRDEKLALLINGYNASTLKLILDHMPTDSIQDIPEADRWDAVRCDIGGRKLSLNQMEHEQIRPKFAEPRVHFALVCAAVGCPPLRKEAYTASRMEEQLQAQTEYVHQHKTWFTFDPSSNQLELTKLYSWYGGDFEQVAGSVSAFAASYSAELKEALENGTTPQPNWLPYDWKLNSIENKQPR